MSGTLATRNFRADDAGGVDQRFKGAPPQSAEDIVNARIDPVGGGWLFDRGLESWWDPSPTLTPGLDTTKFDTYFVQPIDSIYVWQKQYTEQVYYLIESGGTLYYWWGNKGTTAVGNFYDDLVVLDTGRHIAKANEPGTQYVPYANKLVIINGWDAPVIFYGREEVRDYSFTLPTPAPEVLDIQPDYLAGTSALENSVAAPHFDETSTLGLGDPGNGKTNTYYYKVTFITDTGSESPLSSANGLSWTPSATAATQERFGVVLKHLPIGGRGVVARRIYRTKNIKLPELSGAADATYYLVKQVNDNTSEFFIDVTPDSELVETAPGISDTSTISNTYQFGAAWNSSMWLGGGSSQPTRLIFSKQGLPEQFGAFDYFDIGNTNGGAITALVPYYNNLIVFRQRSIDVVRVGNGGSYQVSQLIPDIGTIATNTIKLVPGVGLMFLGYDGIYAISGGLDGGSTFNVQKVSDGLIKETQRINKSYLAKATAVYSSKEREYWVHYTPIGKVSNCRGIVFHTQDGKWSFRRSLSDETYWYFNFNCLASDPAGNIIIGTRPHWVGTPTVLGATGDLVGLHVWSGADYWGYRLTNIGPSQTSLRWSTAGLSLPRTRYESGWTDFGDNTMKNRVFSVEAELIAFGDIDLLLNWSQDYSSVVTSAGTQKQAMSETLYTATEDAVLGPNNGLSKNYFTVGTSSLQEPRLIRVRWDVNTKLVTTFRFRLETEGHPFHLLGYSINFDTRAQQALNQRINLGKGQP